MLHSYLIPETAIWHQKQLSGIRNSYLAAETASWHQKHYYQHISCIHHKKRSIIQNLQLNVLLSLVCAFYSSKSLCLDSSLVGAYPRTQKSLLAKTMIWIVNVVIVWAEHPPLPRIKWQLRGFSRWPRALLSWLHTALCTPLYALQTAHFILHCILLHCVTRSCTDVPSNNVLAALESRKQLLRGPGQLASMIVHQNSCEDLRYCVTLCKFVSHHKSKTPNKVIFLLDPHCNTRLRYHYSGLCKCMKWDKDV